MINHLFAFEIVEKYDKVFVDKFMWLVYNNITNPCKTTTQSIVKEESLCQNRY